MTAPRQPKLFATLDARIAMQRVLHRATEPDRLRIVELMDLVASRKSKDKPTSIEVYLDRVEIIDRAGILHIVRLDDGRVTSAPKPDPLAGQLELFS